LDKNSRIYVAGHTGLVGSAVVRELERKGYRNIVTQKGWDLRFQYETAQWLEDKFVEYIFNCAAHAGGISEAINKPAAMLYDNLMIQANIIDACKRYGVKKLLNIGSSCIYPVNGQQPYKEEQLGEGKTDENWSYAIAKLAGIEFCRACHRQFWSDFITAIPCNMYGPNDNFDLERSHVIPALIRKTIESGKRKDVDIWEDVEVWGDPSPKREMLFVDDFAKAAVFLMEECEYEDLVNGVINVGSGIHHSIGDIVDIIRNTAFDVDRKTVYYKYNPTKPTGIKSKLMDVSRINALGWKAETTLKEGIRKTYEWYKDSAHNQPC
jgi:GDP-L-fucose synthase